MNNTTYQKCRPYFGPLKEEIVIAFKILEKYGKPCVDAIKELREETLLSLPECNNMLRCMYRDRELERLSAENAKLREYVKLYVKAVKCDGCEWCPYDINLVCDVETMPMCDGCKLYDELRKFGIEVD